LAEPNGAAIPNDLTLLACFLMDRRRRFTGKRALVTGAGSGIGEAVARKLHAEGADVVLADVRAEPVEAIAGELAQNASAVHLDVRDEDAVREVARDVDVLANVAGIGSTTSAPDTPLAVWEDVFAVNARGTFLCCKHAIPGMVARRGGSIVNMASAGGLVGLRNRAAYCASKGAVIALTRALAVDHVADGVRVNAVCPGTVDSPWVRRLVEEVGESLDALRARQPMGRLGTPEEIAEAILYLASDDAAYVTGTAFAIDGGLTAA
jgi:2-keto-3-deoxy-L-fuconate dehydrogenase